MMKRFALLGIIMLTLAGCAGVSNRLTTYRRGGYADDPSIIGVRVDYIRMKHTDEGYGGDIVIHAKGEGQSSLDISYGVYTIPFKGHPDLTDGECSVNVFAVTYKYFLSEGMPKGFYFGGGGGQYKFRHKLDEDAQAQKSIDVGSFYRERIHDAVAYHLEMGIDIPVGDSSELGFGVRTVELTADIKQLFDPGANSEAKIDPTVWFVSFAIYF